MSPAAKALFDHPVDACRWPIADAWCPRKATHRSYCREHHLLSIAADQRPAGPKTIAKWLRAMSLRMMAGQAGRKMRRAA